MSERIVNANGIEIWTEAFGDPASAPVLLIMGAYFQGIAWPEEFCAQLADGGRFVIRYDNRDTGRSTKFDYATSPYDLHDMALDALGVLDAYDISSAHIVGASMGGMIAQEIALHHPERVLTLTSMMSTPLAKSFADGTSGPELPGPTAIAWRAFEGVPLAGSTMTREERIDGWTTFARVVAGTLVAFDEPRQRELQARVVDRADNLDVMWNHLPATVASPDRTDELATLATPTLVIHGTSDEVVPLPHGKLTAELIPDAELLVIEGLGHEFDPRALEPAAEAILRHTAIT
jgi:pimeloyl-ACP methyl ester carboxylesterase